MKQPQYINIFDNGKDTLISKNPVSGQYFVITPYETLHCCKGIAAIYMSHAAPPEPKPLPQRIATAAEAVLGRGSAPAMTPAQRRTLPTLAVSALVFLALFAMLYVAIAALWHVTH